MKKLEEIREEIINDLNNREKYWQDLKVNGKGETIIRNKNLWCTENAKNNLDEYVRYEIATMSVNTAKYIAGHEYELPKYIEEHGIELDDLIVTKITDIWSNMARNHKYNKVDAQDAYAQAIYETYGFENSIASTKEIEELEKHRYDSPEDMYAYLLALKSRGQGDLQPNFYNFDANSDLKRSATYRYNEHRRIANMSWDPSKPNRTIDSRYYPDHIEDIYENGDVEIKRPNELYIGRIYADNKDFVDDEVMRTGKSR